MMEENRDGISYNENRPKHKMVVVICLSATW